MRLPITIRTIVVSAVLTVCSLALVGCSDSDSSEPSTTPAVVDVSNGNSIPGTGVGGGTPGSQPPGSTTEGTDDTASVPDPFGRCEPGILNNTIYAGTGLTVLSAVATSTCPVCDTASGAFCINPDTGVCFCLQIGFTS